MSEDRPESHSERQYEPSLAEAVRAFGVVTPEQLDHLEDDDVATYYLAKIAQSNQHRNDRIDSLAAWVLVLLASYGTVALLEDLRDAGGLSL